MQSKVSFDSELRRNWGDIRQTISRAVCLSALTKRSVQIFLVYFNFMNIFFNNYSFINYILFYVIYKALDNCGRTDCDDEEKFFFVFKSLRWPKNVICRLKVNFEGHYLEW